MKKSSDEVRGEATSEKSKRKSRRMPRLSVPRMDKLFNRKSRITENAVKNERKRESVRLTSAFRNLNNSTTHLKVFGSSAVTELNGIPITQICGTDRQLLVVTQDGRVYGKGANDEGQINPECNASFFENKCRVLESPIISNKEVAMVACGEVHSACVTVDGFVITWGNNENGQLGHSRDVLPLKVIPRLVDGLSRESVIQISCAGHATFVLTSLGKVFAFGSGRSGLLGLGDTKNRSEAREIKGRLQGAAVKYIAAGYEHCCALTVSGAAYTWGSNSEGQLGVTRKLSSSNEPIKTMLDQPVSKIRAGLWNTAFVSLEHIHICGRHIESCTQISFSEHVVQLAIDENDLFLVSSNGSVVNMPLKDLDKRSSLGKVSQSCRMQSAMGSLYVVSFDKVLLPETVHPIKYLTASDMYSRCSNSDHRKSIKSLQSGLQFWDYNIFSASFLLPQCYEDNIASGSLVDVEGVVRAFGALEKTVVQSLGEQKGVMYLRSKIAPVLAQLDSLPSSCDDDQLRGFFIMWLSPMMCRMPKELEILLGKIQSMESKSRLFEWIAEEVPEYIYKINLVRPALQLFDRKLQLHNFDQGCIDTCKILQGLHNLRIKGTPPTEFYSEQMNHMRDEDVQQLFELWRRHRHSDMAPLPFNVFTYPFLISAQVKKKVLQMEDHKMMMTNFLFANMFGSNDPFFILEIRREHILHDTMNKLFEIISEKNTQVFKKPLRVKFTGEEGLDAGGVKKEFFQLLSMKIFNPDYGIFTYIRDDIVWFPETSLTAEDLNMVQLIGILIGLSIYNSTLLDVRFPLALYRLLLNDMTPNPGLDELEELDFDLAKSLRQLLEYPDDDVEDVFCLTFDWTFPGIFGTKHVHELKKGGGDIYVSKKNKVEYVQLLCKYLLSEAPASASVRLVHGFAMVVPRELASLRLFLPEELELTVTGSPEIHLEELEVVCSYEGGFSADHRVVKWFWAFLRSLDEGQQKQFLKFTTGSPKAPVGGLKTVKFKIQRAGPDSNHLPTAHTCFNTIMLPDYASEHKLKERLAIAIQNNEGFGLE